MYLKTKYILYTKYSRNAKNNNILKKKKKKKKKNI